MLSTTLNSDFSLLPFGCFSRTLPIPLPAKLFSNEDEESRQESRGSLEVRKTIKKHKLKKSHKIDRVKLEDNGMKFGRWDIEEHKRFLEAMKLHGNCWRLVKQHVRTRTEDQIRSHAQKYYESMVNKEIRRIKESTKGELPLFAVIREYHYTNGVPLLPARRNSNYHCVKEE
eukprot:TRINITY_DN8320_c0_g1_i1.p1 TRINITY_DN8320_c0_g1~~TRINITY_DN8320_c0_g1_i1.p1  ORF type:complete len:172 (+),score=16.50 TRINITY_DN8320_c0_g1_i1:208-723(+)